MFLRRLLRLRRKEEKIEEKPEVEEKVEGEFPGISGAELDKNVGKHIAIVGGKIASSATTAGEALAMARHECSGEEIQLRYVASKQLLLKCKCLEKSQNQ